jgi:AraC-like DNA-binding protein
MARCRPPIVGFSLILEVKMNEPNVTRNRRLRHMGSTYIFRSGVLVERVMCVSRLWNTNFHALPVPEVYVSLEGRMTVEASAWMMRKRSGETRCLPLKDERLKGVEWTPLSRRVELRPGDAVLVESGFPRRVSGEGKFGIVCPQPDSPEGQRALHGADYKTGLALLTPPEEDAEGAVAQLSSLYAEPPKDYARVATEAYERVMGWLPQAPGLAASLPARVAEWAVGTRNLGRLKRLQCELNTHINLDDLARALRTTPWALSRAFRRYFKTNVCSYFRLLRQASAMEYYAREQNSALSMSREPDVNMTDVALEVHYASEPHFANRFQDFYGISPEKFYLSTRFHFVDMDTAMLRKAA